MSEDTTRQLPNDALRQILARFDSMDVRFDSFDARLNALEDKVDRRLQETRPIWEQVLTRLTAIEERLTGVETRLGRVEEEVYGPTAMFVSSASILSNSKTRMMTLKSD